MSESHDPSLDVLLDLDGQVLIVDPAGGHWVKFVVTRVPVSSEKPHGIDYSLTLHGPTGERLVGVCKTHSVSGQGRGDPRDHLHRLPTVRRSEDSDATTLLADLRNVGDGGRRERGGVP